MYGHPEWFGVVRDGPKGMGQRWLDLKYRLLENPQREDPVRYHVVGVAQSNMDIDLTNAFRQIPLAEDTFERLSLLPTESDAIVVADDANRTRLKKLNKL